MRGGAEEFIMGRFRDLWASGKFVITANDEMAELQQQGVAQLFEALSPDLAVPDHTREIFDELKARRGQETGRWLREMAPESVVQVAEVATKEALTPFEETLALLNQLFKSFSDLAYEFNKTAVGSDLLVSVALPMVIEKKMTDEWYCPVTKTCHARLTTRQWSLIFNGKDDKVSVLLLPAGMLIAFTTGQLGDGDNPPFMEILRPAAASQWTIGGENFPPEAFPHLAKELLGDLIRVSSGVMSESEIFSKNTDKLVLGENLAVGYKQQIAESKQGNGIKPLMATPDVSIQEACDIVDETVDCKLTQLYAEAAKLKPDSPNAEQTRRDISAIETFRTKMVEAFEQYTSSRLPIDQARPAVAPAAELLV